MALTPKLRQLEQTYDWYSSEYDNMARDNRWRGPAVAAQTLRTFGRTLNIQLDEIVDIGGGTGLASEFIKTNHPDARITDFDLSSEMLKKAHENNRAHSFVQGDARYLPFREGKFAAATLVGMLYYHDHDNVTLILREAARVVRPGGLIVGTSVMDTHGKVPTFAAHYPHNIRHFAEVLHPHQIIHEHEEVTHIKHNWPVRETIFAALICPTLSS